MDALVQRRVDEDSLDTRASGHKRVVSSTAMQRLSMAQNAIDYTKSVVKHSGNQVEGILKSKGNSIYRRRVVRDDSYWNIDPTVEPLAKEDPGAFIAAKVLIANGGSCTENSWTAFNYLRAHALGETIHVARHSMDHGFALIGELCDFENEEVAVADPWPTRAKACLWDDFFAYESLPFDKVRVVRTEVADGEDRAKVIAGGLSLNSSGKKVLKQTLTNDETTDYIRDTHGLWSTRSSFKEYGGVIYETEE